MRKKLKASGNGWILYFTKPLLKLLGYNPLETKVLITARQNKLIIEPLPVNEVEKYENKMVKGFQKNGCSYGIYFQNTLLEIMDVVPESDYIDIEVDENKLTVKKFV